ncbi:unnamed protein product [Chironomus riparius]|uniref:Uncharacterized protein n=1 Tax=Chironomus riparius TaxID=315576 RepID=A0A9N9RR19_9DIPT|nr:unnamed protein product [Chironomus riparius]
MCNCIKSTCSCCFNLCFSCVECTFRAICMCIIMPILVLAILAFCLFLLYVYIVEPEAYRDFFSSKYINPNKTQVALFGNN